MCGGEDEGIRVDVRCVNRRLAWKLHILDIILKTKQRKKEKNKKEVKRRQQKVMFNHLTVLF
jgi:hypothetical protein